MKRTITALLVGAAFVLGGSLVGGLFYFGKGAANVETARDFVHAATAENAPAPVTSERFGARWILIPQDAGATLQFVSATPDEFEDCPSVEVWFATIATVTEGAEISDIVAALNQVQVSPAVAGEDEQPLAQRLREALRLSSTPPCATAGEAVAQALGLAQLASETEGTAALEPADPPHQFSDLPSGIANGASIAGYN